MAIMKKVDKKNRIRWDYTAQHGASDGVRKMDAKSDKKIHWIKQNMARVWKKKTNTKINL